MRKYTWEEEVEYHKKYAFDCQPGEDFWDCSKRNQRTDYSKRLKKVKNFDQLSDLLGEMHYFSSFSLTGKRRHYSIDIVGHTDTRVEYLYRDGYSSGSCEISKLHNYFDIR